MLSVVTGLALKMHINPLMKLNKHRRTKFMKKVAMIVLAVLISVAFVTTGFTQDKPAAAPDKPAAAPDKPVKADKPAKEKKAKKAKKEKKEAAPKAEEKPAAPAPAPAPAPAKK